MKYFVLALLLFSLLMIDHPKINHFRGQLFSLVGVYGEQEMTKSPTSIELNNELQQMFSGFNHRERGYVESRITDAASAIEFYDSTCSQSGFNDKIRQYNLNLICGAIEKHRADLDDEIMRQR